MQHFSGFFLKCKSNLLLTTVFFFFFFLLNAGFFATVVLNLISRVPLALFIIFLPQ
jgi:hypothetical protein